MSADNGIYIGRWTREDGIYEYRVAHAQAIENCEFDQRFGKCHEYYQVLYFGNQKTHLVKDEAWGQARQMYQEIMESDFPVLEYGVSEIHFDKPFPKYSIEEAGRLLDEYWKSRGKG